MGVEGQKRIAQTTEANALEIEKNAKLYAPVNKQKHGGTLRQGIKAIEISDTQWKIKANATGLAPYSAYQEFGTGGLVEVPTELKDMAIKLKGKGIKKIDMRPQPYLYPAFVKGRTQYIKDLEGDLKDLTK